jgi:hypothetical protein
MPGHRTPGLQKPDKYAVVFFGALQASSEFFVLPQKMAWHRVENAHFSLFGVRLKKYCLGALHFSLFGVGLKKYCWERCTLVYSAWA